MDEEGRLLSFEDTRRYLSFLSYLFPDISYYLSLHLHNCDNAHLPDALNDFFGSNKAKPAPKPAPVVEEKKPEVKKKAAPPAFNFFQQAKPSTPPPAPVTPPPAPKPQKGSGTFSKLSVYPMQCTFTSTFCHSKSNT